VVETKKRRPHAPMDRVLLRALRAERKEHPDRKYVIHYRGGAIGLIRKSFLDAAKKAKLKNVSPHTFKHTCITWHLQNGLTVWEVSGLTATSVATILRVYGHHVQDHLQEAINSTVGRHAQNTRKRQNQGAPLDII
jgi:integrase